MSVRRRGRYIGTTKRKLKTRGWTLPAAVSVFFSHGVASSTCAAAASAAAGVELRRHRGHRHADGLVVPGGRGPRHHHVHQPRCVGGLPDCVCAALARANARGDHLRAARRAGEHHPPSAVGAAHVAAYVPQGRPRGAADQRRWRQPGPHDSLATVLPWPPGVRGFGSGLLYALLVRVRVRVGSTYAALARRQHTGLLSACANAVGTIGHRPCRYDAAALPAHEPPPLRQLRPARAPRDAAPQRAGQA